MEVRRGRLGIGGRSRSGVVLPKDPCQAKAGGKWYLPFRNQDFRGRLGGRCLTWSLTPTFPRVPSPVASTPIRGSRTVRDHPGCELPESAQCRLTELRTGSQPQVASLPPPFPVNATVTAPSLRAASRARYTLRLLPEVDMPTTTSPLTASASTCRWKMCS